MRHHAILSLTPSLMGLVLATPAWALEVDLYGQVNKGLMFLDDGVQQAWRVGDNDMSGSRVGFRGQQRLSATVTASVLLEVELQDADTTNLVTLTPPDAASPAAASLVERHARVGLNGPWGNLFIGRTTGATDGLTEMDLSDVDNLTSDVEKLGDALTFRHANTGAAIGGETVGANWSNIDGFNLLGESNDRRNLVRYETPTWQGWQASAAVANGGDADLALRYTYKNDHWQWRSGVGYINLNNTTIPGADNTTAWNAAVALRHASGWNGSASLGAIDRDNGGLEGGFYYLKAGYAGQAWAVAADYGQAQDISTLGNELTSLGLGAQRELAKGISAALTFRQFDADLATGAPTEAIRLWLLSTAIKF